MSRASISTGSISFDSKPDRATTQASGSQNDACHFVIVSDFSGRSHRGLDAPDTIASRKVIEVDRDNFDEVFAELQVACQFPVDDTLVKFDELDDMHPDVLYEHLDIFNRFRSLKKRLKSSSSFQDAAQEIMQWRQDHSAQQASAAPAEHASDENPVPASGNLLDDILSGAQPEASGSSGFNINALVKDIVAPYVEPKPDPQQKELLASVDEACSHLMRQLMHAPQFQSMESAWRALYWLVKRTETDARLKLFIVDVSEAELVADTEQSASMEESQLYKLLVSQRATTGGTPFSVIVSDTRYGSDVAGLAALSRLGEVADRIGAILLSGATEQLAGCESLGTQADVDDWSFDPSDEVVSAWHDLRAAPHAQSMVITAPRFLTRMPYGKKSSPIEQFQFEELPSENRHAYYLWSNGAWLVASLMTQAYAHNGCIDQLLSLEIDRLPLHVFEDEGESVVTPCAEVHLMDSAAAKLAEQGLTVVRSVLNKDSAMIPEIRLLKL